MVTFVVQGFKEEMTFGMVFFWGIRIIGEPFDKNTEQGREAPETHR